MVSTDTTEPSEPTFAQMPLSDEMRRALGDMGYDRPTPVQTAVWEPAVAGRDIVVQARTGTGKTAAFGLPIMDRIVRRATRKVQALVLCPTRELALQVSRELDQLGAHREISTVAIYGGAPMGTQIDALNGGAQVVAGTPGRVLDHLRRGTLDATNIRALVLDESDEMLSMGFERELSAIIEHLPKERQTLLFSATVPPDIERMARSKLKDPEFVILSSDQVGALEISHFIYRISGNKLGALLQLIDIEDPESAIVFCNTRDQTETIAAGLKNHGFDAAWLNGDLPQADREKVMKATREGRLRFLVATDVAARGIDISHLTHVINCDFPQDAEAYVHRTGRTGRAGRTGTAISLVTPQDIGSLYILRLTYKIRPIERTVPSDREQRTRLEADIVLSLVETFSPRGDAEHRALARRLLSHDDVESVIAGILRAHLTSHPELPEVSESRRRGRQPAPVVAPSPTPRRAEQRTEPRTATRPERAQRPERLERPARNGGDQPTPAEARPDGPPRAKIDAPPPRAPRPARTSSDERAPRAARSKPGERPARAAQSDEVVVTEQSIADERVGDAPSRGKRKRRRSTATRGDTETSAGVAPRDAEPRRSRPSARGNAAQKSDSDAPPSTQTSGSEAPPKPSAPAAPARDDGKTLELHVNVGRKDGARVRALKSLLADGGIDSERVHRVRVRDHYCFVEVDREVSEAALDALSGAELDGHKLIASISARSKGENDDRDD